MIKHTFMKLNLSCRLFLIIIVLFLVPYLTLFSWVYKKAETIIRDKAQSLERENLNQTKNDIESLCLNMIQASDYLISLNNYGVLYREASTKGYSYLKCWQDANEQIQNVNNSLLSSNADISVLSNDQLLYSTLPQQKFRFEDFFAEQIVPSVYFTNAHQSYRRFESNQTFVSYIRKLPPFSPKSFYLVISLPASSFSNLLGSTAGTMGLCDSSGYTICGIHTPKGSKDFQEEISIHLSGWRLTDTISTEFLYQDIYELRTFMFVVSLGLLMICLLATFFAIYSQLRPLFKLKEQMQQVMAGNLNAEIATTDSKDEISSLSRTFNNMVTEIGHLIEEIQVTQKRESELRFEMLLAQINPHFLFNTLNSIKWMSVMSGTEHITNTITALGRLLEISMNKVNDVLPIEEELENIKSYIQIQQVRYPGRFDVTYHIEKGILKEHTLKLILQPLVENSILHNIEARDFLMIDISGRCENGIIILQVQDNGTGMDADTMKEILKPKKQGKKGYVFFGLGVSNVQERIQLAYGPDYGLQYDSDGNSFTTVTIRFPQHKQIDSLLSKRRENNDKGTDCR